MSLFRIDTYDNKTPMTPGDLLGRVCCGSGLVQDRYKDHDHLTPEATTPQISCIKSATSEKEHWLRYLTRPDYSKCLGKSLLRMRVQTPS